MHLLFIDNYDSFTYNLVQYFGELGATSEVIRNDSVRPEEINAENFNAIVISLDPATRTGLELASKSLKGFLKLNLFLAYVLGTNVLLKHLGEKIVRAGHLMHGKTSPVHHNNTDLFLNLPNPLTATRYHSLLIEPTSMPDCLEITAAQKMRKLWELSIKPYLFGVSNFIPNPWPQKKEL